MSHGDVAAARGAGAGAAEARQAWRLRDVVVIDGVVHDKIHEVRAPGCRRAPFTEGMR